MKASPVPSVELVPVDLVTAVNPRVRNPRIFKEIVANIADLGLKKPITVTRRQHADGVRYELVCGQRRLEAYRLLGQSTIPALVVEADNDDSLVMSLVENCAPSSAPRDRPASRHRGVEATWLPQANIQRVIIPVQWNQEAYGKPRQ